MKKLPKNTKTRSYFLLIKSTKTKFHSFTFQMYRYPFFTLPLKVEFRKMLEHEFINFQSNQSPYKEVSYFYLKKKQCTYTILPFTSPS